MIIIVAGPHRSGTSAMAGMLAKNGVMMGELQHRQPAPNYENPKGYYENFRFRAVNDQILTSHGYRVKDHKAANMPTWPTPSEDQFYSMATLVREYAGRYKDWGWKDPRTCLTLKYWITVCSEHAEDPRIVVMHRPRWEIAQSLRHYRGVPDSDGLALADSYYAVLRKHLDEVPEQYQVHVDFRQLKQQPRQVADIIQDRLGIRMPDVSHIDPRVSKHGADEDPQEGGGGDPGIQETAKELS